MGRQVAALAAVRAAADAELRDAQGLVQRARLALDAAIRQELIARGKVNGVQAAEAALDGDQ